MSARVYAIDGLQALFGRDSVDDSLWRDIERFELAALPIVNRIWNLAELNHQDRWMVLHAHDEASRVLYEQRLAEALQAFETALAGDKPASCAAAFLLHPQLWQSFYHRETHHYVYHYFASIQSRLLCQLAGAYLQRHQPADWSARVARRILALCTAARVAGAPGLAECVGYILAHDDAAAAPLLDALCAGDWAAAWQHTVLLAGQAPLDGATVPLAQRPILDSWAKLSLVDRLRTLWQEEGVQQSEALLWRLHQQGRLDAAAFQQLLEVLPSSLMSVNHLLMSHATRAAESAAAPEQQAIFVARLQGLADDVLWKMLGDFRPEAWPVLAQIGFLSGGHYLLRLAEEVERRSFTRLPHDSYSRDRLDRLLAHLLGVLARRADDDSARLVALLRRLSAETLLAILPHAQAYEGDICAALGWDGGVDLVVLLRQLESDTPARSSHPNAGVVRRDEILRLVAPLDETQLRALLEAFAEQLPAAVTLVRAALGWNRKELRRLLGRRNQLAVRALPLLPFEQPGELLQRYQLLIKYQRDIGGSRAGQKAYERAAVQAGLANLALHAGYADATRLEWAMEDQIGAQLTTLGQQWQIEGYTLTLALRAGQPTIDICNSKRQLKRTPVAVMRDYAYHEVRAVLGQAQDQERRYRQAFLDTMRRGQPLSAEELALLCRNPLALQLLERLVLIDEAGACGLLHAEDGSLEGCYGERVRISGGVSIAHSYTLMQMGLLNDWQSEIIRRQIVQPFRQVFREIYTITPAELLACYSSGRLAGRSLKNRQALAVLANLGWRLDDYGSVTKPLYDLGYAAHFETGGYSDDEEATATTGAISFWPLDQRRHAGVGEQRIPLADVPPLVFSEVLRDLDMVTVIAHESEERGTSKEVLRQRGDLLRATVAALGLSQVQVDEPFVHVRGSLSSYRMHLATGAIYLASGQYLCIVPSAKQRKAIYLPFEASGEPLISELVSKMLLLANDTQISDATILAQIAPLRQAA